MLTKNQERNGTISLIRCIAMVFIVTCHFFQYYENELAWWFNVGVQMFFCISGFLYGNKRIDDSIGFVWKNFKKILIPYFTFLFPCIIMYFIFAQEHIDIVTAFKAVLCSGVIDGISHLWFISYILFCYMITPFLYKFADKIKKLRCSYALMMLVALLVMGQVVFSAYNSYFSFGGISCYIFGYFLAFILSQYKRIVFKRLTCGIIITTVIFNVFRVYIRYILKQASPAFSLFEQYAHVLLGISIFLIIYISLKNFRYHRILKISDKYSYYIYLVHQLFILSPFSLMAVTKATYLNWLFVLLGTFLSAIALHLVSNRILTAVDKAERSLVKNISK